MTLFMTADPHYGHDRIIVHSARPFADVDSMNAAMVANYNAVVGPDDTVLFLGDFALHKRFVQPFVEQLNGRKELLPGNHDGCHPRHKGHARERRRYVEESGFDVVHDGTTLDMEIEGVGPVLLSHMPLRREGYEEKYAEYRITEAQMAGKVALIHGHVHEAWRRRGRMLNVGVDVWNFTPVSIDKIRAALLDEGDSQ